MIDDFTSAGRRDGEVDCSHGDNRRHIMSVMLTAICGPFMDCKVLFCRLMRLGHKVYSKEKYLLNELTDQEVDGAVRSHDASGYSN